MQFQDRLFIIHIPKTAGTSLRQIVQQIYPPEQVCGIYSDVRFLSVEDFPSLSEGEKNCYRVFIGHVEMKFLKHLPTSLPVCCMTILRDPVARVRSQYNHLANVLHDKGFSFSELMIPNNHPDWMNLLPASVDNAQVRYLCGTEKVIPWGQCSAFHLQQAKDNLHKQFDIVGCSEFLDETLYLAHALLGWPTTPARKVNVGAEMENSVFWKITAEDETRILDINQLDVELYEFARNLMWERIAQTAPDWQQRLADFKGELAVANNNAQYALNTALYLQLNPDVRAARIDPTFHFLFQGQFECRDGTPPLSNQRKRFTRQCFEPWQPIDTNTGGGSPCPERPCVSIPERLEASKKNLRYQLMIGVPDETCRQCTRVVEIVLPDYLQELGRRGLAYDTKEIATDQSSRVVKMTPVSRNSLCPCGSGKRYKHCCGAEALGSDFELGLRDTMISALARQKAKDLAGAEALYRKALSIQPDEPDCLHMLGVICLGSGRYKEAFEAVYRALTLTEWRVDSMRHNMGLILAELLAGANADKARLVQRQYQEFCRQRDITRIERDPLISVIIPSYNHGLWIEEALESVYSQTYRRLELIVIDDGSSDDSPELIRKSLIRCPFPCRFIARENHGAHATINEGVMLATGEYINILNSDDLFPNDRIAAMVEHVARRDADWGFGGVSFFDGAGKNIAPVDNRYVSGLVEQLAQMSKWETLGAALLGCNVTISTGNLFARKSFFDALGGFNDYRYNHDWDFCLRATLESEPVFVPRNVYAYRMHDSNTISEATAGQGPLIEANRIFSEYFLVATNGTAPKNNFAPTIHAWGIRFFLWVLQHGKASLLTSQTLQNLADLATSTAPRSENSLPFEEEEVDIFQHPESEMNDPRLKARVSDYGSSR